LAYPWFTGKFFNKVLIVSFVSEEDDDDDEEEEEEEDLVFEDEEDIYDNSTL
jgi:hypothetical protein